MYENRSNVLPNHLHCSEYHVHHRENVPRTKGSEAGNVPDILP